MFHNKKHLYGEELLAPRPTLKLEDHHLSTVRDCLFNIFAATLHVGGHSSNCNLSTCHGAVTGTHLSWYLSQYLSIFNAWAKNIFSEWYLFPVCCFRFLSMCITKKEALFSLFCSIFVCSICKFVCDLF